MCPVEASQATEVNIYPREQYNELLAKIKLLESSEKKSTTDYYNLKRYDIFIIGGYESEQVSEQNSNLDVSS
jgi:hypothetical protein